MHKTQYGNTSNMKKQSYMIPPKVHSSLATDLKDIEVNEMSYKNNKRMIIK